MWMALFYSSQSKLIESSRKVMEHRSPTKFVSINSTLDSLEVGVLEELPGAERCNPLLETDETPRGHTAIVSFPDTHSLLPFIKPPPARGLELWVHNEPKEGFAGEGHSDTPESQNFIYSCSNEVSKSEYCKCWCYLWRNFHLIFVYKNHIQNKTLVSFRKVDSLLM